MKIFRGLVCLTLLAVVASVGVADEKEKKGKGKQGRKAPSVTQRFAARLELTEEQKKKAGEIDKMFAEKVKGLAAKRRSILTEDQIKAQREAMKAARESGKKGPEAKKAIDAAVSLTEEQKKQQKELDAAQKELNTAVLAELKKILTEEQLAKLPGQKNGKRPGAKKKPDAKKGEKKPTKGNKAKAAE